MRFTAYDSKPGDAKAAAAAAPSPSSISSYLLCLCMDDDVHSYVCTKESRYLAFTLDLRVLMLRERENETRKVKKRRRLWLRFRFLLVRSKTTPEAICNPCSFVRKRERERQRVSRCCNDDINTVRRNPREMHPPPPLLLRRSNFSRSPQGEKEKKIMKKNPTSSC